MTRAAQCHISYRAEFRMIFATHRIVSPVPSHRAATEHRNHKRCECPLAVFTSRMEAVAGMIAARAISPGRRPRQPWRRYQAGLAAERAGTEAIYPSPQFPPAPPPWQVSVGRKKTRANRATGTTALTAVMIKPATSLFRNRIMIVRFL